MSRPELKELPSAGDVVYDESRDRVGEFQAECRGLLFLRPIGGGCEWTASREYIRQATEAEKRGVRS